MTALIMNGNVNGWYNFLQSQPWALKRRLKFLF